MLKKVFSKLGLPDTAQRVYSYLLERGASSARQISENLGIARPSVYDQLKSLIHNGLIVERYEESRKVFQVDEVKNLPDLIASKIEELQKEQKAVLAMLPTLSKKAESVEPRIKFYSGAEGIKQVCKDIMWHKNIETYSMWPIREMVRVLGEDYFADLNRRRIRQGISVKAIWPKDQALSIKEYPFFGIGGGHLREIRVPPKEMTWKMGAWLYADKVAFVSSRDETFGFIVHSKDFHEFLKAQFEVIWKVSKKMEPQPKYTDKFLETI